MGQEPGERNLRYRGSLLVRYKPKRVHRVEAASLVNKREVKASAPRSLGIRIVPPILAREESARKRRPRQHAESFLTAQRQQLVLEITSDQ